MPAAGLSIGIDTTITFTDIDGIKQFMIIEKFSMKENADVMTKISMDGQARFPKLHKGWSGNFTTQRGNAVLDSYFAAQEAAYYQGIDQLPLSITQLITEINGTVTKWVYTNGVLTLDDAGTWSGEDIVTQSVTVMAGRRNKQI